jgi:CPA2 family monovalent cation:H+ antiporter-2
MEHLLFQATVYLAAAVIAVPLAQRLGFGSVLGYLVAGIVIGPVLGLVGSETAELQHIAEFGVVMMLFIIGLELEPRALWDMRRSLLGLGGAQIVLTVALIALGAIWLGHPVQTALAIGMILALSSTAIVLQTLAEKDLMRTEGGRSIFSVLLTQDIAVIPMLALLPLLALSGNARTAEPAAGHGAEPGPASGAGHGGDHGGGPTTVAEDNAEAALSLVESLPGWGATLFTLGAVAVIILFGIYATRPVFHFVHMARLRELHTALALLIVIGIAFLMSMVGLSPALGAFLAGVVLASSEFRHELESDIEPFKGLLLGLFFITVGAGISFATLFAAPLEILGLTLALVGVKLAVLMVLARLGGLGRHDRWLFTLGLAQAGEFGFVLVSFSIQQAVVPGEVGGTLLLVIALSMLMTPLLFILWEALRHRFKSDREAPDADDIDDQQPVIIAGIGRFGQVVNRMLQSAGFKTTVLDHDLQTIQLMRKFGFKGFFGDPSRPELLHAAGIERARVLVVALDDKEATTRLVSYARRVHPDLFIVARARDRLHVYELYSAGADQIVRELFDSSLRAARYVLEHMGLSDREAAAMEHTFYRMDRAAVRELAALWKPGVPVQDNAAYIERARELNKDLETALVSKYHGTPFDRDEDEDDDAEDTPGGGADHPGGRHAAE